MQEQTFGILINIQCLRHINKHTMLALLSYPSSYWLSDRTTWYGFHPPTQIIVPNYSNTLAGLVIDYRSVSKSVRATCGNYWLVIEGKLTTMHCIVRGPRPLLQCMVAKPTYINCCMVALPIHRHIDYVYIKPFPLMVMHELAK